MACLSHLMDTNTARHFTKGQTAYKIEFSFDVDRPRTVLTVTELVIDSMGAKQGTAHRKHDSQMLKMHLYPNHRLFANINEAIEVGTEEGRKHLEAHKARNIELYVAWLAKYEPASKYPNAVAGVKAKLNAFQTETPAFEVVYR